jgi:hypothetical protein
VVLKKEEQDSQKQEEAEIENPITPGMAAAQRLARLASERQAAATEEKVIVPTTNDEDQLVRDPKTKDDANELIDRKSIEKLVEEAVI